MRKLAPFFRRKGLLLQALVCSTAVNTVHGMLVQAVPCTVAWLPSAVLSVDLSVLVWWQVVGKSASHAHRGSGCYMLAPVCVLMLYCSTAKLAGSGVQRDVLTESRTQALGSTGCLLFAPAALFPTLYLIMYLFAKLRGHVLLFFCTKGCDSTAPCVCG
jgi:hypothetical protein